MKGFILFIVLALWSSQIAALEAANLRGARSLDQTTTPNITVENEENSNVTESALVNKLPDLPIEILTPEQEAYKLSHSFVPTPPEGFKQVKITNLKRDKGIMELYAYGIPSFLLKSIAAHHKLVKADTREEKENFAKRGFLMPGPYLLDLTYIFKKKAEDGYTFIFGVTVNRCAERACTSRPYPCRNTAQFAVFTPSAQGIQDGLKRTFLDWKVEMAPEGYLKCPVINF